MVGGQQLDVQEGSAAIASATAICAASTDPGPVPEVLGPDSSVNMPMRIGRSAAAAVRVMPRPPRTAAP